MGLKHANPDTYTSDLQEALDEFEKALLWRYEVDCEEEIQIWTTHGYEPEHPGSTGFGKSERYDEAKKHLSDWAADGRDKARKEIADWGTQDLDKLESAFDDLKSAAKLLGGHHKAGKLKGISGLTNAINDKCDWAAWAGASGEAFKENFGASVDPTMENQTSIAASLANLYAARTCIIESVRRNTVNALKRAADGLRETEDTGDETGNWFVVGVILLPVGLAVGPITGAVISAGQLVAGTLDSEDPDQGFSNDIKAIMDALVRQLHLAMEDAVSHEYELGDKVVELQMDIKGLKSKQLELYDFTGGDYSPAAPADGFGVSADDVYGLSALCFEASREYENVIAKVVSTDIADSDMRGEGHVETAADVELIDTKDALLSFLKTTCARYYEAGERLHDTARDYFGVEGDNKGIIKALEKELEIDLQVGLDGRHRDPDLNGDGDGKGGSVDKHVKDSDRDDIEDLPQSAPGGVEYGSGGV